VAVIAYKNISSSRGLHTSLSHSGSITMSYCENVTKTKLKYRCETNTSGKQSEKVSAMLADVTSIFSKVSLNFIHQFQQGFTKHLLQVYGRRLPVDYVLLLSTFIQKILRNI
jgi:hypothetical protein